MDEYLAYIFTQISTIALWGVVERDYVKHEKNSLLAFGKIIRRASLCKDMTQLTDAVESGLKAMFDSNEAKIVFIEGNKLVWYGNEPQNAPLTTGLCGYVLKNRIPQTIVRAVENIECNMMVDIQTNIPLYVIPLSVDGVYIGVVEMTKKNLINLSEIGEDHKYVPVEESVLRIFKQLALLLKDIILSIKHN